MIYREINNIEFAINPNLSNEIYFEESFIKSRKINPANISPTELCKVIAGDNYFPLILTWELLDKCNFACPFCYIVGHSNHKVIPFSKAKKHIQDIINDGLLYCTLTGGEALVHKDFIDIYKFLKTSGVLVEIYSNGYNIDDKHIEVFKEFPPYKLEISIYGTTQEEFDKVTGTKNQDFNTTLHNVLLLKNLGLNVRCKTPLNNLTESNFDKIGKWCKKNGIDYYYSTNIYQGYDGKDLNGYSANFENIVKYDTKNIIDIESEYTGSFNIFESKGIKRCYTCGVRNYGLHINANFELLPCSETHIDECTFNILEIGFEKALKMNRKFVHKRMDKPILGCIYDCQASSICNMCPAKAKTIFNQQNKILGFEVPTGHCDRQRMKHSSIINELLN